MHSFVAYIDESGDDGFHFPDGKPGSSVWFVLSAGVVRQTVDLEQCKLVTRVRELIRKPPNAVLHFTDLQHLHRVVFCSEIANSRFRAISVIAHKPSLARKTFANGRLYFYASRFLLERVSWLCRAHKKEGDGDGSVRIIFSNRGGTSYDSFREYLETLKAARDFYDVQIDWDIIKPNNIETIPHRFSMGLQIADAIASSTYQATEKHPQLRLTEERYARALGPIFYRRNGKVLSYGIKTYPNAFTPPEAAETLRWTKEV